jgi:ribonuclease R
MKKERKKHLRRLRERAEKRREARHRETVEGILRIAPGGYGFLDTVAADGSAGEIFVPAKFVNGALDKDRVALEILPPRPGHPEDSARGPVGRVAEILERTREALVGEVLPGGVVRPLNPRLPESVVMRGFRKGAKVGDWVRLSLKTDAGEPHGTVRQVLGRAGEIAADLDAVMAEFELPPRYGEADDEAALAIVPREIPRREYQNLTVLTIDPTDAKDFDDALSITPGENEGTFEVGIHISDVAAYIEPRSHFDEAAAKRGFSCYLPGRTLPMLPPSLTAKISLKAGRPGLAHSHFMTVDAKTGEILKTRREHTIITISRRLDYDTVQKFHDTGEAPSEWSAAERDAIRDLLALSQAMRRRRMEQEEFIELPIPEIRVLCDEATNQIEGLVRKFSREADNLVEEFMLAANSAVGDELVNSGIAGIFRVHPEPAPDKTLEFSELMDEAFHLYPGNIADRKGCNKFIAGLPDDPRRPVILNHLLRALPRASYAAQAQLHFALGKVRYCHFTSPIRRYSDLLVHQQLWNFDTHKRTRSANSLERAAALLSEQEERGDNAYYAANDRMKLRYLEEQLESGAANMYEAVIVKVLNAGLQVDIGELGLYGFVPMEQLRGGAFRHGRRAVVEHGTGSYKPGDYIYLKLARIDFARGSAVFALAGR